MGIHWLRVESDSLQLITTITTGSPISNLYGILSDINLSLDSFGSISFKYISREANMLADSLAKQALCLLDRNSL